MADLIRYMATREGVEKLGSHRLFTQFDLPIDLDTVADRVAAHDGVILTEVVSLRREDAERLHFNNAEAWKNLVRRNMNEIAKAHRIKVEDLEWYGAFHNTTNHSYLPIKHPFCYTRQCIVKTSQQHRSKFEPHKTKITRKSSGLFLFLWYPVVLEKEVPTWIR